ncbi:MAG TPA: VOC family protein [Vicinamibacterales bacterium]|jgi:methylmalonyl-CoA/ethylmalonyl-CoA epimerase
MHIDHIAVAVRSVDAAADRLCPLLGYARKTEKVTNTRQKVTVLFLGKDGSIDIKLIEPSDADSPLWDAVRKGGGLHHVCFKVADVAASTADLAARGVRVTAQPAPGEAFDDHLIAFLYLGMGVSVELIDTDERRGRVT